MCVFSPAARPLLSRSSPSIPPNTVAVSSRTTMTVVVPASGNANSLASACPISAVTLMQSLPMVSGASPEGPHPYS